MKYKIMITVVLVSAVWSLSLSSCGIVIETTQASKGETILSSREFRANLEITAESAIERELGFCVHEISPLIYSFHHFNGTLMEYVGRDNFHAWTETSGDYFDEKTGCNSKSNIIEFVKYFDITKDEMEKLIASDSNLYYLYDYNIDIIYSGDEKLIENYYNNPENRKAELYNKRAIFDLKSAMLGYVYGPNGEYQDKTKHLFDEWSDTKDGFSHFNLTQWSVVEFIEYFDVPREYVEAYLKGDNMINGADITFNVDMMYSNDQRIDWMIKQGVDAVVIDDMYSSRDGIFRDDLMEANNIDDSGEANISGDEENLFHGEMLTEAHLMDYHNCPGIFIDYVGRNNFDEWIKQTDVINYDEAGHPIFENGCSVPKCTIYEFIKYFGISREEFHDLWYYSRVYYLWDYNPDILFSDDIELIDKYYRRTYDEQEQMMAAKKSELNFLDRLNYLYYDDPVYGEAFRKVYDLGYNRFSIPQLIYEANLPRTDLEECQKALISNYSDMAIA